MKVILTEAAITDLIHIGRFIQVDNPVRAATFVDELERRCEALGSAPKAYPLLPGREATGIRRRPYRDYLIFYRVDEAENAVEVLRVLNGAREYEPLLFPDNDGAVD